MRTLHLAAIALAAITTRVHGQERNEAAGATELGPEYENLQALVGTWELRVEGVKEKGSAQIQSILGGRFITEDVRIPFGDFSMEWHGVIGYDRVKGQYTGVWFDNANNTTRSTSGEADETGRILTFRGKHAGNSEFLWRVTNDGMNAMTIEMFEVGQDGQQTQVMKVRGQKQQ